MARNWEGFYQWLNDNIVDPNQGGPGKGNIKEAKRSEYPVLSGQWYGYIKVLVNGLEFYLGKNLTTYSGNNWTNNSKNHILAYDDAKTFFQLASGRGDSFRWGSHTFFLSSHQNILDDYEGLLNDWRGENKKRITELEEELQMEREEAAKALEKAKEWREKQLAERDQKITQLEEKNFNLEQHFQKFKELFTLIFPNQSYDFANFQDEFKRLKFQDLRPKLEKQQSQVKELVISTKNKVGGSFASIVDLLLEIQKLNKVGGSFASIVDLLLEIQKQLSITEQGSNEYYLIQGQLIAYRTILQTKLNSEELQTLLTKQTELHQLEKHLDSLQIQEPQLETKIEQSPYLSQQ